MGGKNKPDNSAVVNEQKAEAAQEAAKEAARQARIQQGLASIKQAFHGSPVMASTTSPYDWSKFKPVANAAEAQYESVASPAQLAAPHAPLYSGTNLPADYTVVQTAKPATPGAAAPGAAADPYARTRAVAATNLKTNAVNNQVIPNTPQGGGATGAGTGGTTWAVKGPDGKLHYQGDPFDITTQTDTGQTAGGFNDAFYNKYKQAVLDYYTPQVDKQYSDAKKQAVYGLGRSGNLISSAANDLTADLKGQYDINTAGVRNQADTAAGDLRSQVNAEEQKAVSQLYATEDPEVAANQSLAAVRDISLQQPQMSPLSALFNVATIGGANVLKGYQGQQNLNTFNASLPTASRSSSIKK